jgi:hypothetical protein
MILDNLITRLRTLGFIIGQEETQKRVSIAAEIRVLAAMKRRIFTDGIATDGSQIGQYSTTSFYQNPTKLIGVAASGVKPAGKNGQANFKNGKAKKTKYLALGYQQLRELTGRQSDYVDLNFSGSMQGALQFGIRAGIAVVGFVNEEAAEIMAQNEQRFGKDILTVTEEEQAAGAQAARAELEAILNEI